MTFELLHHFRPDLFLKLVIGIRTAATGRFFPLTECVPCNPGRNFTGMLLIFYWRMTRVLERGKGHKERWSFSCSRIVPNRFIGVPCFIEPVIRRRCAGCTDVSFEPQIKTDVTVRRFDRQTGSLCPRQARQRFAAAAVVLYPAHLSQIRLSLRNILLRHRV